MKSIPILVFVGVVAVLAIGGRLQHDFIYFQF